MRNLVKVLLLSTTLVGMSCVTLAADIISTDTVGYYESANGDRIGGTVETYNGTKYLVNDGKFVAELKNGSWSTLTTLSSAGADALGFDTSFGKNGLWDGAFWGGMTDYQQPTVHGSGNVSVTGAQNMQLENTYGIMVSSKGMVFAAGNNSELSKATLAHLQNVNNVTTAQTNYNSLQTAANSAQTAASAANAKVTNLQNEIKTWQNKADNRESGYWKASAETEVIKYKAELEKAQTEANKLNAAAKAAQTEADNAKTRLTTAQNKANTSAKTLQTEMQKNLNNYVDSKTDWTPEMKNAAKTGGSMNEAIFNEYKSKSGSEAKISDAMKNDPKSLSNYLNEKMANGTDSEKSAAKAALDQLNEVNNDKKLQELSKGARSIESDNSNNNGRTGRGISKTSESGGTTATGTGGVQTFSDISKFVSPGDAPGGTEWKFGDYGTVTKTEDGKYMLTPKGYDTPAEITESQLQDLLNDAQNGTTPTTQNVPGDGSDATDGVGPAGVEGGPNAPGAEAPEAKDSERQFSISEGAAIDPLRILVQILSAVTAENDLRIEEDINIKAGETAGDVGSLENTALAQMRAQSAIDGVTTLSNTPIGAASGVKELLASATVDVSKLLDENVSGNSNEAKAKEIRRRRGELLNQYTMAAIRIAEGMNSVSTRFRERASLLVAEINGATTEATAYGAVQDAGRYVLLETLRSLALGSAQMGVQASRILYDQDVEVKNGQN